jgi:hypothetical protein
MTILAEIFKYEKVSLQGLKEESNPSKWKVIRKISSASNVSMIKENSDTEL